MTASFTGLSRTADLTLKVSTRFYSWIDTSAVETNNGALIRNAVANTKNLAELEKFAQHKLDAHRYPNDRFTFRSARCENCGVIPVTLDIEHHTGSTGDNFRGIIRVTCSNCGDQFQFLSFTGEHRKPEFMETPKCVCGSTRFLTAESEHYEGDEGIPGFFDEGIVAGQCAECGRHQAFVFTD